MRLILLLIFGILFKSVNANKLILYPDKDIISLDGYRWCWTFEDNSDKASIKDVEEFSWIQPTKEGLNFGIARHPHWIKFDLINPQQTQITRYLYLPYHHIEYIDVYIMHEGKILKHYKTGTARPYSNKSLTARGYPLLINMSPNQKVRVYIRIDHRNLPLRAGMFLLTEEKMIDAQKSSQSLMWFWKGVVGTAMLLSLITFFFIRSRLFLFYSLLLIGIILFVGFELGDYFQLFEIDRRNTIIDIKHLGNIIVIFSFPMFLNELTPLRELHPRLWKWTMWLVAPFIVLFLLVLIDPLKETILLFIITNYAIYISALIFFMQLVFLFNAAIHKKKNAQLLLIIYTFYVAIFWITNSLPNLGLIKDGTINVYAILLISSIMEVLTFMILVARETFLIYKERTQLIQLRKNHQKNLLLATVESQERERNKVGRELHDMVGANMAVIKQKIDKSNVELRNIVHQTIDIIRNLSHGLITPQLKNEDFADEISELCILSSTDKLQVQCFFYNWENYDANQDATTHLYRIVQELLQNAIKHSKSTRAYLQFSIENNKLILMYDDNGVGFNINHKTSKGIGLLNIENRVKLLKGEIHFDNNGATTGTSIFMDFPI